MRANIQPGLFDTARPLNSTRTPGDERTAATAKPVSRGASDRKVPFTERPTCTVKEACHAVGLGRTKLYEMIKDGVLQTSTVGRRRLIAVPSLLQAIRCKDDTDRSAADLR